MKDIKDYLHLYLGCDWMVVCDDGMYYDTGDGMGINHNDKGFVFNLHDIVVFNHAARYGIYSDRMSWSDYLTSNCKPILRKLDSMTRKEKQVVELSADRMNDQNSTIEAFADTTKYLLNKHFDIFGLIDEGLAIDRATLKLTNDEQKPENLPLLLPLTKKSKHMKGLPKSIFVVVDKNGKVFTDSARLTHDQCRDHFVKEWMPVIAPYIDSHTCWQVFNCFERAGYKIEEIEIPKPSPDES